MVFAIPQAMLAAVESDNDQTRAERNRVTHEEEMYKQDISQLEKSLRYSFCQTLVTFALLDFRYASHIFDSLPWIVKNQRIWISEWGFS